MTKMSFCVISTEIPDRLARTVGAEERHGRSPAAFRLRQQSFGSPLPAPAGRGHIASNCPEDETRGFAAGERRPENDGTSGFLSSICSF